MSITLTYTVPGHNSPSVAPDPITPLDGTQNIIGNFATTGNIESAVDIDESFIFGRARIDSRVGDTAYFSHYDFSTSTNFALCHQSGSGQTTINSPNNINLSFAGTPQFQISNLLFNAAVAGGPQIANQAPTNTGAVFRPDKAFNTYGLGGVGGLPAIITNSLRAVHWDASQNQINAGNIQLGLNQKLILDDDLDTYFESTTDDQVRLTLGAGPAYMVWGGSGSTQWNGSLVTRLQVDAGETSSGDIGLRVAPVSSATAPSPVQNSPIFRLDGHAWNTTTVASELRHISMQLRVGSGDPTSAELLLRSNQGGELGTLSSDGAFRLPDGSAANPTWSFASSPNYGMYTSTSELNFTVGGQEQLALTVGGASVRAPGSAVVPSIRMRNTNQGLYSPADCEMAVTTSGTQAVRWTHGQQQINQRGITAAENTDEPFVFGRARIDSRVTDTAQFSHYDHDTTVTAALRQDGDGQVYLNSATGVSLWITSNMQGKWLWTNNAQDFIGAAGNAAMIRNLTSTAIVPTLVPGRGSPGTGVGGAPGEVAVITNSLSAARWDTSQNQINAGNIRVSQGNRYYTEAPGSLENYIYAPAANLISVVINGGQKVQFSQTLATALTAWNHAIGTLAETTSVEGISLTNTTLAAVGVQQHSAISAWKGQGWQTVADTSHEVKFGIQTRPIQGVGVLPGGEFVVMVDVDGAGYADKARINHDGSNDSQFLINNTGVDFTRPGYGFDGAPIQRQTGLGYGPGGGAILISNGSRILSAGPAGTTHHLRTFHQTGTAANPSLAFASDTGFDTGLFLAAQNEVGLSTNALEAVRWDASQNQINQGDIRLGISQRLAFDTDLDTFYQALGDDDLILQIGGATHVRYTNSATVFGNSATPIFMDRNANGVNATTVQKLYVRNNTAATAVLNQNSPMLQFQGFGWKTDATAASQAVAFSMQAQPETGTANPTGSFVFRSIINGLSNEVMKIGEQETSIITTALEAVRWDASQNQINAGDISIPATKSLRFGGPTGDTYIRESTADTLFYFTGGTARFTMSTALNQSTVTMRAARNGVGTSTATVGFDSLNSTAALNGAQQWSPINTWEGRGFAATPAESQEVKFGAQLETVQGTLNPTGRLVFKSNIDLAGYNDILAITASGTIEAQDGTVTAPSYTFASNPDRGMFTHSDHLEFVHGGLHQLYMDGAGIVIRLGGSPSRPALTFANNESDGIFRAGTSVIGIATAGLESVRWTNQTQTNAGAIQAPSGLVGTPTHSFTDSANSGMYLDIVGIPAMAAGGVRAQRWEPTFIRNFLPLYVPTGTAAAPPISFVSDVGQDTGLFRPIENAVGVTASGIEAMRVDSSTTAGDTRFMLYDVDNATLERVTVGAADSGGAGFKVLRIPN